MLKNQNMLSQDKSLTKSLAFLPQINKRCNDPVFSEFSATKKQKIQKKVVQFFSSNFSQKFEKLEIEIWKSRRFLIFQTKQTPIYANFFETLHSELFKSTISNARKTVKTGTDFSQKNPKFALKTEYKLNEENEHHQFDPNDKKQACQFIGNKKAKNLEKSNFLKMETFKIKKEFIGKNSVYFAPVNIDISEVSDFGSSVPSDQKPLKSKMMKNNPMCASTQNLNFSKTQKIELVNLENKTKMPKKAKLVAQKENEHNRENQKERINFQPNSFRKSKSFLTETDKLFGGQNLLKFTKVESIEINERVKIKEDDLGEFQECKGNESENIEMEFNQKEEEFERSPQIKTSLPPSKKDASLFFKSEENSSPENLKNSGICEPRNLKKQKMNPLVNSCVDIVGNFGLGTCDLTMTSYESCKTLDTLGNCHHINPMSASTVLVSQFCQLASESFAGPVESFEKAKIPSKELKIKSEKTAKIKSQILAQLVILLPQKSRTLHLFSIGSNGSESLILDSVRSSLGNKIDQISESIRGTVVEHSLPFSFELIRPLVEPGFEASKLCIMALQSVTRMEVGRALSPELLTPEITNLMLIFHFLVIDNSGFWDLNFRKKSDLMEEICGFYAINCAKMDLENPPKCKDLGFSQKLKLEDFLENNKSVFRIISDVNINSFYLSIAFFVFEAICYFGLRKFVGFMEKKRDFEQNRKNALFEVLFLFEKKMYFEEKIREITDLEFELIALKVEDV